VLGELGDNPRWFTDAAAVRSFAGTAPDRPRVGAKPSVSGARRHTEQYANNRSWAAEAAPAADARAQDRPRS